jgi:hypothetical protein
MRALCQHGAFSLKPTLETYGRSLLGLPPMPCSSDGEVIALGATADARVRSVAVARSIHTTRRHLEEHAEDDYLDGDHKRAEARRLRAALERKRRIKEYVHDERHRASPPGPAVDPAAIPILVEEPRAYVRHGASREELVAVLRRLPPGVADGLAGIRLGLGLEHQRLSHDDEDEREDEDGDADPLTGRRPSLEIQPGVHSGRVLGVYWPDRAEIYLCAYVYEAAVPERRIKELYLKLRTLATLVHEVAHHHDHTARVARGRWLADETTPREIYAERMEHAWVQSVVLPYLEEVHAAEVAHLRAWLLRHGGVDVPLAVLLDDPRVTRKDGLIACAFTFRCAFEILLADVGAGRDPLETRLELARQIHYTDEYTIPRQILAGVLAEHPAHPDAHTQLADLDVHEEHHAAAEARCREVLARDPGWFDAWDVLTDALRYQGRWSEVARASTRGISCAASASDAAGLLRFRARAHLELGDHAALEHDLAGLALGRRLDQRWAWTLRAMQRLRRGELEAALELATRLLEDPLFMGRAELAAVRFEAAHRLGRPEAAGALTAFELERLRDAVHGPWVDRLIELGAPAS